MKLFLDTNVMLDFLGEREPFYISAAKIATLADKRKLKIIVSALSFATVSYFLAKYEGLKKTTEKFVKDKISFSQRIKKYQVVILVVVEK